MGIFKAVFRIVVGIIFGFASAIALTPAFAAFTSGKDTATLIVMMSLIMVCGLVALFAPTIRRAFGRGFLVLGAATFGLPISAFLLSGRVASEMIDGAEESARAATAIGSGLAGVAVTGVATFFGVILGAIFLIIGLVLALGGRGEVVVVEARAK